MAENETTTPETKAAEAPAPKTTLASDDAAWQKSAAQRLQAAANEEREASEAKAEPVSDEPKETSTAAPAKGKPAKVSKPATEGKTDFKQQATRRDSVAQREQRVALAERAVAENFQRLKAAEGTIAQQAATVQAFNQALSERDYNQAARVFGHNDWNALLRDQIERETNPNYAELKQIRAEREQEKAQQQAEAEAVQQRQIAAAHKQREADLSTELSKSSVPLLREFADVPEVVRRIKKIQEEYWDGSTTISPEDAARVKRNGKSVLDELDGIGERAVRAKAGTQTEQAPARTAQPASKTRAAAPPAKRPVPAKTTGPKTDWLRSATERYQRAINEGD